MNLIALLGRMVISSCGSLRDLDASSSARGQRLPGPKWHHARMRVLPTNQAFQGRPRSSSSTTDESCPSNSALSGVFDSFTDTTEISASSAIPTQGLSRSSMYSYFDLIILGCGAGYRVLRRTDLIAAAAAKSPSFSFLYM